MPGVPCTASATNAFDRCMWTIRGFEPPNQYDSVQAFHEAAQATAGDDWPQLDDEARNNIEVAAGHSPGRRDVSNAYLGSSPLEESPAISGGVSFFFSFFLRPPFRHLTFTSLAVSNWPVGRVLMSNLNRRGSWKRVRYGGREALRSVPMRTTK